MCASEALGATGESRRFHLVGYSRRIWAIAALMAGSYWTVAFSATRPWQLLGVAFGAAQVLIPQPPTPRPTTRVVHSAPVHECGASALPAPRFAAWRESDLDWPTAALPRPANWRGAAGGAGGGDVPGHGSPL